MAVRRSEQELGAKHDGVVLVLGFDAVELRVVRHHEPIVQRDHDVLRERVADTGAELTTDDRVVFVRGAGVVDLKAIQTDVNSADIRRARPSPWRRAATAIAACSTPLCAIGAAAASSPLTPASFRTCAPAPAGGSSGRARPIMRCTRSRARVVGSPRQQKLPVSQLVAMGHGPDGGGDLGKLTRSPSRQFLRRPGPLELRQGTARIHTLVAWDSLRWVYGSFGYQQFDLLPNIWYLETP